MRKQIMPHFLMILRRLNFVIFALSVISFKSCSKNENEFTLGQEFIESQTNIVIIDTFTIGISTVIIDSIPTSGTDTMLFGNYEDSIFGKVTCNSYFQVGLPDDYLFADNDIYDSTTLILTYSGYNYGDTSQPMQITIHQLLEQIEQYSTGYLYSTSAITYEPENIGSQIFVPRPNSGDSLEIRINDNIGLDLFEKFMNDDEIVSTETNFLNYFKGIVIVSDGDINTAIIGFNANEQDLYLRIYSHRIGETLQELQNDFPMIYSDNQFNSIQHDFSNSELNIVECQKEAIPSIKTNDKAFVQGGTALMTKIKFPYLQDILLFEEGLIIKAELIIAPVKSSYSDFSLPEDLILYETDKINRLGNVIYNSNGTVHTASFVLDELYNEETSYTFDVTDFINNELSDYYYDTEHGLLVSLPSNKLLASFERLILEARNPKPKLKLYYLSY